MLLLLFFFWLNLAIAKDSGKTRFFVDYFASREVKMVTSGLCSQDTNLKLYKHFSENKIRFDSFDLERMNKTKIVERLTSRIFKLGVLLDLACPRTIELLKEANANDLFTLSNSLTFWLVLTRTHVSEKSLTKSAESQASIVGEPIQFLTQPYQDRKNEKYLLEINKKVNWEFVQDYAKSSKKELEIGKTSPNATDVDAILGMKLFLDNEFILAVPAHLKIFPYSLFRIYRTTADSKPKVEKLGQFGRGGKIRKVNLENGILRAASAIFQPEAFTTIDDLATREADVWSKMSYPHVKLLAEDLNFRIIIRFFDDYGWQRNGTFGHLMGLLQQKEIELSAAALLMRIDRFDTVDFLQCPFRLQTGILFREPSLSSVSNIFLLPFSKGIWISTGVVLLLTIVALRCRVLAGKALLPPDENVANYFDVVGYVVGAVCQQGFSATPASPSARASLLVALLTSLALFTSYSACIVALIQSSSSAISSIGDITRSDMEVGIQANFPLYKVIMQEAAHPVLKEFYRRKVLGKGEKAFCDRREGIERMRTGMFAFEVELTAGYKLIRETYKEIEKCGLKEIDPVPKPFICIAVRKRSPYKQVFTPRLIWQEEVGLFDRSWNLWVDQKPKCEVGRIGFISVGLMECRSALQVFAYGILAAVVIFFAELFRGRNRKRRQNSLVQFPFGDRWPSKNLPRSNSPFFIDFRH